MANSQNECRRMIVKALDECDSLRTVLAAKGFRAIVYGGRSNAIFPDPRMIEPGRLARYIRWCGGCRLE